MNKVRVKVMPAETHVKVQYEGEELTIKELVDRLHKYKFLIGFWNDEAEKDMKLADELRKRLADVRSVRSGRWINRTEAYNDVPKYSCSKCGFVHIGLRTRFCPDCGAKMDGGDDDGI